MKRRARIDVVLGVMAAIFSTLTETSFAESQMSRSGPLFLLQSSQRGMTYQLLSVGLSLLDLPANGRPLDASLRKAHERILAAELLPWANQEPCVANVLRGSVKIFDSHMFPLVR